MENKQFNYGEILERQKDAQNPLMAIIIGLCVGLEESAEMINDFNHADEDEGGGVISYGVQNFVNAQRERVFKLELAGLFRPLLLKIQRPLASNDPDVTERCIALAYNEDRSLNERLTLGEGAQAWFGDDLKMYVKARLWIDGTLQLIARTEEQSW